MKGCDCDRVTVDDRMIDRKEAANLIGIRVQTLVVWGMEGKGPPFFKLAGHAVRYRLSEVWDWIETQQKVGGSSQ